MSLRIQMTGSFGILISCLIMTSFVNGVASNLHEVVAHHLMCGDDTSHVTRSLTDCSKYVVCSNGLVLVLSCPEGEVYDELLGCHIPFLQERIYCSQLILDNMPTTCLASPRAKLPSLTSCAQYFDCDAAVSTSRDVLDYVTECPYPQLFSLHTKRCEPFHKVQCIGRLEPKAPCDYLQYHKVCNNTKKCLSCGTKHPSCIGRPDGPQKLKGHLQIYVVCLAERTVNIGVCRPDSVFSEVTKSCVSQNQSTILPLKPLSSDQIKKFVLSTNNLFKTIQTNRDTSHNPYGEMQDTKS